MHASFDVTENLEILKKLNTTCISFWVLRGSMQREWLQTTKTASVSFRAASLQPTQILGNFSHHSGVWCSIDGFSFTSWTIRSQDCNKDENSMKLVREKKKLEFVSLLYHFKKNCVPCGTCQIVQNISWTFPRSKSWRLCWYKKNLTSFIPYATKCRLLVF